VFNEVFVFWFPNFGFAALLLAVLLIVNLAGPRAAAAAQALFTAAAVFTLIGIALTGILRGSPSASPDITASIGRSGHSAAVAAITFIGYDMLQYTPQSSTNRRLAKVAQIGLIAGGALFALWNSAALLHVGPDRLAQTTIPHLLAAKAILGPAGRVAIGLVVIAGACAAVNFLFLSVARMLARMAQQELLPSFWGRSAERPWAALVILTAATGLLMAAGFAGSDWLDVSIRAALLLWLVFYAMSHLTALFPGRSQPESSDRSGAPLRKVRHATLALAMIAVAIVLGATDDAPLSLLAAMAAMMAMAAALALSGRMTARPTGAPPKPLDSQLSKGELP
jgi:amino acid transporter